MRELEQYSRAVCNWYRAKGIIDLHEYHYVDKMGIDAKKYLAYCTHGIKVSLVQVMQQQDLHNQHPELSHLGYYDRFTKL